MKSNTKENLDERGRNRERGGRKGEEKRVTG